MHKSDKIHAHTIMMHSVQALYCNWDCHWDCLRILGTAHLQKLPSLPQGVKEIKEKLGEYASYDEIRFVFEVYKKHIPA